MAYYVVDFIDIISPVDEGLYEYDEGEYVLSEDESPDREKIYYGYEEDEEPVEEDEYEEIDVDVGDDLDDETYEFVDGEYVITADETAQAGKSYFVYTGTLYAPPIDVDTLYYAITDVVENPVEAGLYERLSDGRYVLTEDTDYDEDKVYYKALEEADKQPIEEIVSDPYYSPSDIVSDGNQEEEIATVATGLNMVYAWTDCVDDPSAAGLYEIVNGAFVLTQDTELVEGKAYYQHYVYNDYYQADMTGIENPSFSLNPYYELVNGSYVKTTDTEVSPLKAYYRSHTDDENFYIPDPVRAMRAEAS